jgi:phospholipase DDHD2
LIDRFVPPPFFKVMMHFPTSSASLGALDDWGQVQPASDPALKPRVVHRGLEGLPEIPDGEQAEVDHLVFVVHGIGAACDIKFR